MSRIASVSGRLVLAIGTVAVSLMMGACQGTGGGFGGPLGGLEKARAAQISAEQRGPWFIGRRYYTAGTRFWGFLRRPGESWEKSQMVIINEKEMKQPDRLPEYNPGGNAHGFDHNYEYRMWGYFSGERVYDPNSNYIIPEFVLQKYEVVSRNPGYLFQPQESYNPKLLPPYRPTR